MSQSIKYNEFLHLYWYSSPYWLVVKVLLSKLMLSHTFWWHILICIFIFQSGVFPCLSLSWTRIIFHFTRELCPLHDDVAYFILIFLRCCAFFYLKFLILIHGQFYGGSCMGGMCHFSCGVYPVCYDCHQFYRKMEWLIGNWFCLFCIRFVEDQYFNNLYMFPA